MKRYLKKTWIYFYTLICWIMLFAWAILVTATLAVWKLITLPFWIVRRVMKKKK